MFLFFFSFMLPFPVSLFFYICCSLSKYLYLCIRICVCKHIFYESLFSNLICTFLYLSVENKKKFITKKKKKSQNEPMHTGPRTVRRAGQPDGRCSVPGHPGVRGQSWGLWGPAPCPRQGGPARHHEVRGHEAGRHHAGRQAARQRGRVHLGELGQLLGLPAKKINILYII